GSRSAERSRCFASARAQPLPAPISAMTAAHGFHLDLTPGTTTKPAWPKPAGRAKFGAASALRPDGGALAGARYSFGPPAPGDFPAAPARRPPRGAPNAHRLALPSAVEDPGPGRAGVPRRRPSERIPRGRPRSGLLSDAVWPLHARRRSAARRAPGEGHQPVGVSLARGHAGRA